MKNQIITLGNNEMFAYHSAGKFVATTKPSRESTTTTSNYRVNASPALGDSTSKYPAVAPWGKKNNWPQLILDSISKYGIGLNGLKFNRNLMIGKGLALFEDVGADGKIDNRIVRFSDEPEINEFLKRCRYKRYFKDAANDYEYLSINFAQVILTKNFQKVDRIVRTDPADCRFQVMNPETKRIEKMFLSSKWADGISHTHESVESLWVIDPLMSAEEVRAWAKKNKIYKFIYPAFDTMIGRKYYPFKAWHAVIENGWLDVALAVPEMKKALFENQMSIKYHVEIPEGYWSAKYGQDKWANYSEKRKDELREETLDKINTWLTGPQNTGKTLLTFYDVDDTGRELPQVRITAVDDKMKDGAYIPDTQNANIEILGSMDLDPTMVGFGFAGSKLGAGSGSDKQQAYNMRTGMKTSDREIILEPFEFAWEYNGYDENKKLGFKDLQLTKLDANPTGAQTIMEG